MYNTEESMVRTYVYIATDIGPQKLTGYILYKVVSGYVLCDFPTALISKHVSIYTNM